MNQSLIVELILKNGLFLERNSPFFVAIISTLKEKKFFEKVLYLLCAFLLNCCKKDTYSKMHDFMRDWTSLLYKTQYKSQYTSQYKLTENVSN